MNRTHLPSFPSPKQATRLKSPVLKHGVLRRSVIENGWSQVERERVDERFDRKLKDMPGITQNVTGIGARRLF